MQKLQVSPVQPELPMNEMTAPRLSIGSFQKSLETLYKAPNEGNTPDYICGYLFRTVGFLHKRVTMETAPTGQQDLIRSFVRTISWLFSLSSKVGIDVQKAFLDRYPKLCPTCLERTCVCFRTGKQTPTYMPKIREELETARSAITGGRETTDIKFDFARKIILDVYPNNEVIWQYAGPWRHFSKLLEETAEVHEALCGFLRGDRKLGAVSAEVADVLAWILGAWNILLPDRSVDQELHNYYFEGCPVCFSNPCICKPYSGRPDGLTDLSTLQTVKSELEELASITTTRRGEIIELIQLLEYAIQTQQDPKARMALSQVRRKIEDIRMTTAKSGDDLGNKWFKPLANILAAVQQSQT